MDRPLAKSMVDAILQCTEILNESLREVQTRGTPDEFERYRRAVGKIMGTMHFDVLNPVLRRFPEAAPAGFPMPGDDELE